MNAMFDIDENTKLIIQKMWGNTISVFAKKGDATQIFELNLDDQIDLQFYTSIVEKCKYITILRERDDENDE